MRLRRMARPLSRKELSVISVFLLSWFCRFFVGVSNGVSGRMRSQPIVTVNCRGRNTKAPIAPAEALAALRQAGNGIWWPGITIHGDRHEGWRATVLRL